MSNCCLFTAEFAVVPAATFLISLLPASIPLLSRVTPPTVTLLKLTSSVVATVISLPVLVIVMFLPSTKLTVSPPDTAVVAPPLV